jgi:uncharacterized membrane protein YgcG
MEQRPLRLGDLVDDYCPRERRVTDHAVVAMIDDAIKQTRCTACDAEHPYKGGKAPRRKKAATTGRLYKEVLAGITDSDAPRVSASPDADDERAVDVVDEAPDAASVDAVLAEDPVEEPASVALDSAEDSDVPAPDEGPVHRPLIRATLPRPEGMKVERPIPEFTVRHNGNGRPHGNGNFRKPQPRFNRSGGSGGSGGGGGARHGRGGQGFGGGRPGGGRRRGR